MKPTPEQRAAAERLNGWLTGGEMTFQSIEKYHADIAAVCRALLPQDGEDEPVTGEGLERIGFVRPMQSAATNNRLLDIGGVRLVHHGRCSSVKVAYWTVNGKRIPSEIALSCIGDVLDLIERLKGKP